MTISEKILRLIKKERIINKNGILHGALYVVEFTGSIDDFKHKVDLAYQEIKNK